MHLEERRGYDQSQRGVGFPLHERLYLNQLRYAAHPISGLLALPIGASVAT